MSKNYIKLLTIEQGDKFLEKTRNDHRYKAFINIYGTLDFEMLEHHPGYSGCHIDFSDFHFHVYYGGFEAPSGCHDYSKEFRLFMMQQKNIDTVEYAKDLLEFVKKDKNNKIQEITKEAQKKIALVNQKSGDEIAFCENMLNLVQSNPDIEFNIK